jgi:hypothetical protein
MSYEGVGGLFCSYRRAPGAAGCCLEFRNAQGGHGSLRNESASIALAPFPALINVKGDPAEGRAREVLTRHAPLLMRVKMASAPKRIQWR